MRGRNGKRKQLTTEWKQQREEKQGLRENRNPSARWEGEARGERRKRRVGERGRRKGRRK